jgi:exopolysaccharide production protein ExoQ
MPPTLALIIWFMLLIGLLYLDPAKQANTSIALWVPLIWMFILGSRLPMQWFGGQGMTAEAAALQEGNPLDRTVFAVLIMMAVVILLSRSFRWDSFFANNIFLFTFVLFALISVFWSDFPFIAFKRWLRDLGNYLVILVVLSDPRPLDAVRTLFRRLCYLLVPLSVVLIKYFPLVGKQYSDWTGANYFVGATTSKNMLGALCLVSGIFFFSDTLSRWAERKEPRTKKIIAINFAFLTMTLWLLRLANSATSLVCLVIGCLIVVVGHSKSAKRHPGFFRALIPTTFCLYLILGFGFDINGSLASIVGRDPTLTGRADIWRVVLGMHTNPLIGTGFESFWLGPRLQAIWKVVGPINESHNGYIEVYLNLGLIGTCLLGAWLISSYRDIWRQFKSPPALASLRLAFWTVILFYNMTEAAFRSGLMWLIFLLVAITVPQTAAAKVRDVPVFNRATAGDRLRKPRLETVRQRR